MPGLKDLHKELKKWLNTPALGRVGATGKEEANGTKLY